MSSQAVDLEVRGTRPLEPLLAALGARVIVQHYKRGYGRSHASLALRSVPWTLESALRRWVRVLSTLRGEAQRALRASTVLASIGRYTDAPIVVEAADVAALARLGIGIEVVVYRVDTTASPAPNRRFGAMRGRARSGDLFGK